MAPPKQVKSETPTKSWKTNQISLFCFETWNPLSLSLFSLNWNIFYYFRFITLSHFLETHSFLHRYLDLLIDSMSDSSASTTSIGEEEVFDLDFLLSSLEFRWLLLVSILIREIIWRRMEAGEVARRPPVSRSGRRNQGGAGATCSGSSCFLSIFLPSASRWGFLGWIGSRGPIGSTSIGIGTSLAGAEAIGRWSLGTELSAMCGLTWRRRSGHSMGSPAAWGRRWRGLGWCCWVLGQIRWWSFLCISWRLILRWWACCASGASTSFGASRSLLELGCSSCMSCPSWIGIKTSFFLLWFYNWDVLIWRNCLIVWF